MGLGHSKVVTFYHGWMPDGDPLEKEEQEDAHWDLQHDVHTYLKVLG